MTSFDYHRPRPVLPLTAPAPLPKPPQAGLGITSFVVSLISGLGAIILAIVAALLIKSPGYGDGPESPVNYLLGTWLYATAVLSLIGIVFGIGGVLQRGRRIGLAITGLVLNIMMPLGVFALLVIGMAVHTMDRLSSAEFMRPDRPTATAAAAVADAGTGETASLGWATVVGASVTLAAFLALRMCFRSPGESPTGAGPLSFPPPLPPPLPKL